MAFYLCNTEAVFLFVKTAMTDNSDRGVLYIGVFLSLFGSENSITGDGKN